MDYAPRAEVHGQAQKETASMSVSAVCSDADNNHGVLWAHLRGTSPQTLEGDDIYLRTENKDKEEELAGQEQCV